MHALSDALMLDLLGLLPAHALANLALVSKSLYCFTTHEDLWKALVVEVGHIPFPPHSWAPSGLPLPHSH